VETTKRTLTVHTERGTVLCQVVRIERTADPSTWIVVVNAGDWLAGGYYPNCIMRKDAVTTTGSYTVIDYIVGEGNSYIHTKGLWRPAQVVKLFGASVDRP
jgi:hypothetical protein